VLRSSRRLRSAVAVLVLAAVPASRAGAASRCRDADQARAFATCLARATAVFTTCALRGGAPCATDERAARAVARVREHTIGRCASPGSDEGAGSSVATRFDVACLAHAGALAAGAYEAADDGNPRRCRKALGAAVTRLAARVFRAESRCAGEDAACGARTARRIAAIVRQGRRTALRRCGAKRVDPRLVDGVLARAHASLRCALPVASPGRAPCPPVDALVTDASALPEPGTRLLQVSSYDRTGGNADLGVGPDTAPFLAALGLPPLEVDFSYLYRDGDRYVVFDEVGPGVVWRIWMTGLDALLAAGGLRGDIAFELDDEATPRLVLPRAQLFSGTTPPFTAPLVGDATVSSGGFYSLVPIPFARRLRITTSTVPNWLQITFARLPPDRVVASFDPAVAARKGPASREPIGIPSNATRTLAVPSVAPAATTPVWSRDGGGTIVGIEVTPPAGTSDIPVGVELRATFDGAPTPQVALPLDDLFGASLGAPARSYLFGRDGPTYYARFAMPFRRGARIELGNQGAEPFLGWTVAISHLDGIPEVPTTFHATAAQAHLEPDGADYRLLETSGAGHVVGVVLTAGCGEAGRCVLSNLPGLDGAHLEGDERITIDGSRWPQIHGTGLEDFFNGGFYFIRGAFTLPTHGNPQQVPETSMRRPGRNLRSAYRLFLGDAIPFEHDLRLAIEHGPADDVPADLASVVFWYGREEPMLVESDRVTLGDAASETAHELRADDRADVTLTSSFRGDASDVPVTATGMTATRTRFRVSVPSGNTGVRLRRLADLAGGRQRARIRVNGAFAGTWATSDVNPVLRWAELDVELPASLTAGQTSLEIELDASTSPSPWTAFGYTAFAHVR
jgi:hypothetical protein